LIIPRTLSQADFLKAWASGFMDSDIRNLTSTKIHALASELTPDLRLEPVLSSRILNGKVGRYDVVSNLEDIFKGWGCSCGSEAPCVHWAILVLWARAHLDLIELNGAAEVAPAPGNKRKRQMLRLYPDTRKLLDLILEIVSNLHDQGLQQASDSTCNRLEAAAIMAKNAMLTRLEKKIKQIQSEIKRYLNKDPLFSLESYGARLNEATQLCHQLDFLLVRANENQREGVATTDALVEFLGRRPENEKPPPFAFQVVGSSLWTSDSGMQGATLYAWDLDRDRIITLHNARPMIGYSASAKSVLEIITPAGVALSSLAHGAFVTAGAQVKKGGSRLSLSRGLGLRRIPRVGYDDPRFAKLKVDDWNALVSLNSGEDEINQWMQMLLKPRAYLEPRIESARHLYWQDLVDNHGGLFSLRVPMTETNRDLINNLRHLYESNMLPPLLLVQTMVGGENARRGYPLSAIWPQSVLTAQGHLVTECHLSWEKSPELL